MWQALFLVLTGLLISGCASDSSSPSASANRLEQGKGIYQRRCADCHDPGRSGPSIREPEEWDARQLASVGIVKRHASMRLPKGSPPVASISERDESDVLLYLAQILNEAEQRY